MVPGHRTGNDSISYLLFILSVLFIYLKLLNTYHVPHIDLNTGDSEANRAKFPPLEFVHLKLKEKNGSAYHRVGTCLKIQKFLQSHQ